MTQPDPRDVLQRLTRPGASIRSVAHELGRANDAPWAYVAHWTNCGWWTDYQKRETSCTCGLTALFIGTTRSAKHRARKETE